MLEKKIEVGNYSDEQLVEIQIPLHMPYYSDKDFEPAYGETEWNGIHYRYVKRKISNNILYLLCIPNNEKSNILFAKNNFAKETTDSPQNNFPAKQPSPVFKLMLSVYITQENNSRFSLLNNYKKKHLSINTILINQFDPNTPSQPPEFI